MIRLYHFPLSPFCRKVRLTLAEKKLEVELVEERYWDPSPDFLRRNPAGKVPILKIDARIMSESQAICEYLEETYPTPSLMPSDPDTRYEVRRICAWFDDKFHAEVTSKLLYERVNKKIMGQGYPDSKAVKTGASVLSGLHLGCGLEPARRGERLVRQDQIPPFVPYAVGGSDLGLSTAGALCRSGFLMAGPGGALPPDPQRIFSHRGWS